MSVRFICVTVNDDLTCGASLLVTMTFAERRSPVVLAPAASCMLDPDTVAVSQLAEVVMLNWSRWGRLFSVRVKALSSEPMLPMALVMIDGS